MSIRKSSIIYAPSTPGATLIPLRPIRLIRKLNEEKKIDTEGTIHHFKESLGEENFFLLSNLVKETSTRILQKGDANLLIPGFSFFNPIETTPYSVPELNPNLGNIFSNLNELVSDINFPMPIEPVGDMGLALRVLLMLMEANEHKWLIAVYTQQVHMNVYRLFNVGGEDDIIHHANLGISIDNTDTIADLEVGHQWLTQVCTNHQLAKAEKISEDFFFSFQNIKPEQILTLEQASSTGVQVL